MAKLPEGGRIGNLAALALCDAQPGTRIWVDSEGCEYIAVPTGNAASNAVAGPVDPEPISWQPSGMIAVDGAGSSAAVSRVRGRTIDESSGTLDIDGERVAKATLTAASGTTVVKSVAIAASTVVQAVYDWNAYDGDDNHVRGKQIATVRRGATGDASLLLSEFAAGFVDTTTIAATPWAPTAALNVNALEFRLTADATNDLIAEGTLALDVRDISDAPALPAGDPIEEARATLLATSPEVALFADVGRTDSGDVPPHVSPWADQSGNGHHATKVVGDVTYAVDGGGAASLHWPASPTQASFTLAVTVPEATTHTFAWRCDVAGTATGYQLIIADGSRWLAIDSASHHIHWSNIGGITDLGAIVDGEHDCVLVLGATHLTLYVDGVARSPVAYTADLVFGAGKWCTIGGMASNFSIFGATLWDVCIWGDALDTAARVAAFSAFNVAAFGAVS